MLQFAQSCEPIPARKSGVKAVAKAAGPHGSAKVARSACPCKPSDVYGHLKLHLCTAKSYITGMDGAALGKPGKETLLVEFAGAKRPDHQELAKALFDKATRKSTKEGLVKERERLYTTPLLK